jgi:hypothetical protein
MLCFKKTLFIFKVYEREAILEKIKFSCKTLKLLPNRSFNRKMFELQMCILGHNPPNQCFFGPFGTPELPKISLPSRDREWEVTFFREWDRDRVSRKCLLSRPLADSFAVGRRQKTTSLHVWNGQG